MNNKYVNRSKISEAKFREIVRLFAMDLTAIQIAELAGLNRNTVNRYLRGLRERIMEFCLVTEPPGFPSISNDEEKPDRLLVGLKEKNGAVYAGIIDHAGVKEMERRLPKNGEKNYLPDYVENAFDLIVDPKKKIRIYLCGKQLYRQKGQHYRRMEGFWGFAKSRLEKFKGLHRSTYLLHLKECEFRYNHEKEELYGLTLKIIRNKPLF